jgi:RDD family/GYF domain 2
MHWFYSINQQVYGPVSVDELIELMRREPGSVEAVWREGMPDWIPPEHVNEIVRRLRQPPPLGDRQASFHQPVLTNAASPPNELEPALSPTSTRSNKKDNAGSDPRRRKANTHPWRRFFARTFDLYLFVAVLMIVVGVIFPEAFMNSSDKTANNAAYGFLLTMAYAPFEIFFLYAFGTTFGKLLHGIKLTNASKPSLPFGSTAHRTFTVWLKGMGLGIPIVSLFTMAAAHNRLTKDGKTSWDAQYDFDVSHQRWGVGRGVLVTLCWLSLVGLYVGSYVLDSAAQKSAQNQQQTTAAITAADVIEAVRQIKAEKQLPERLDKYTRLVDIRASGLQIIYQHELDTRLDEEEDVASFASQAQKMVMPKVCGNPDMVSLMQLGLGYVYRYRDYVGRDVAVLPITATDCITTGQTSKARKDQLPQQ